MAERVTVTYRAVDDLPGEVPALFAATDGHLDVLFSRAATVDEIVNALGSMRCELARTAFDLHAVA